jgi:hypothetical protein
MKKAIFILMSVIGLFTLGKSQAQELSTVESDGGTTSHVDGDGCTVTTHTVYTWPPIKNLQQDGRRIPAVRSLVSPAD